MNGGEVYFWDLGRGFCELGHQVTLYAAPGSKPPHEDCKCKLKYLPGTYGEISLASEFAVCDWYFDEIAAHDLILDCSHNHAFAETVGWYHRDLQVKVCIVLNGVTSHVPRCGSYNYVVGSEKWKQLLTMGRTQFFGTPLAAKYGDSLDPVEERDIAAVIHWAIDTNFYTPSEEVEKGDSLLWLSRPTDYKGLDDALEIAATLQLPLTIAPGFGNSSHRKEYAQYKEAIAEAQRRGAKIKEVKLPLTSKHHQRKRELYQQAKALIYPIKSHEPFGMVVVEALACGTPVVAYNRGAMPEIILDGETGWLCDNKSDMIEKIQLLDSLSNLKCREDSVQRWHYLRAASEYIQLCEGNNG